MSLNKVYELVDKGEEYIINQSLGRAIEQYRLAQDEILKVIDSFQKNITVLDENLIIVIESLHTEIESRLAKIEKINEKLYSKSTGTESNKKKAPPIKIDNDEQLNGQNSHLSPVLSPFEITNNHIKQSIGGTINVDQSIAPQLDKTLKGDQESGLISLSNPILDTMVNELDNSINQKIPSTYKPIIQKELNTLKVKLATYELKTKNDQSLREQLLVEENTDLRQHVEKLTTRWENLVESAKQKRRGSIQ